MAMLLPGFGCWSQDQTTARLGKTNKGGGKFIEGINKNTKLMEWLCSCSASVVGHKTNNGAAGALRGNTNEGGKNCKMLDVIFTVLLICKFKMTLKIWFIPFEVVL